MVSHNKITFTAEYCRARKIPYRIVHEALFIGGKQVCFSLYNHTYRDILIMIDNFVDYNPVTMDYICTRV